MHNNGTFRSMVIVFIVFLASFDPYCAIADKKEKLDGYYIFSLIGSEKYDQASIEIEKSLQINPNCSFCYFARGYILDQKNNEKNAMQNYNKAIALSPNSPQYYFYRGKLKVSMAIFQAAGYSEEDKEKGLKSGIEDFTKGIQLKPENVHLYYRERGDAYLSISLFSKALMDFQNVLKIVKTDPTLFCKIGKSYLELKEPQKALNFFLEAESKGQIDEFCEIDIAKAYSLEGEKEKATEYIEKALDEDGATAHLGINGSDRRWDNIRDTAIFKKIKKWENKK